MKHLVIAALGLALAGAGILLVVLPSCNTAPGETCYGDRVSALVIDAGAPDPACASCLQAQCCDPVGRCEALSGCADQVRAAHACVVDGGPAAEEACTTPLGGPETTAHQLYACMRGKCGTSDRFAAPCALSSCDLDPSVVLFITPRCDRCFTGSCCDEINRCYGDRRCKLTIECIVDHCKSTIGHEMTALGALGPEVISQVENATCAPGGAGGAGASGPAPVLPGFQGSCVQICLDSFAPEEDRTPAVIQSRCLSLRTYACGASNACGDECLYDAGAADAE